MQTFYSNGKLLLTGEYIVLDGAKALAVPTKFGQSLTVVPISASQLIWKSLDANNNIWFEHCFTLADLNTPNYNGPNDLANRLHQILTVAKTLNSDFLNSNQGVLVTTSLDFPTNWGLGSSSTLLNNIAQWAEINPFKLSKTTFGGSGYDIACASNNTAIIYSTHNNTPEITPIVFNPSFGSKIHFIHLNKKQNSRDAIKTYQANKPDISKTIAKINAITSQLTSIKTQSEFDKLIQEHERIIGNITNQLPVQTRLFSDYKNAIKSLGGWGGDFVLATGDSSYVKTYFEAKGYKTIVSYKDMVLQ